MRGEVEGEKTFVELNVLTDSYIMLLQEGKDIGQAPGRRFFEVKDIAGEECFVVGQSGCLSETPSKRK